MQAVGDGKAGYAYIEQRERNSALEAQKWCFIDAGNGTYYIMSALNTCIDIHSGVTSDGIQYGHILVTKQCFKSGN